PHFLEIDADRRQIFRDIADVLVLGAARQDLATDPQERGGDSLFGSGRVRGWHDHQDSSSSTVRSTPSLAAGRLIGLWGCFEKRRCPSTGRGGVSLMRRRKLDNGLINPLLHAGEVVHEATDLRPSTLSRVR